MLVKENILKFLLEACSKANVFHPVIKLVLLLFLGPWVPHRASAAVSRQAAGQSSTVQAANTPNFHSRTRKFGTLNSQVWHTHVASLALDTHVANLALGNRVPRRLRTVGISHKKCNILAVL